MITSNPDSLQRPTSSTPLVPFQMLPLVKPAECPLEIWQKQVMTAMDKMSSDEEFRLEIAKNLS